MTGKRQRLQDRVEHMREACKNIRDDVGQATKEQFLADGKTQRTVIESIMSSPCARNCNSCGRYLRIVCVPTRGPWKTGSKAVPSRMHKPRC